jgi:O-acetyl-ADP-ribose deacetylase (regulator of RNase III)
MWLPSGIDIELIRWRSPAIQREYVTHGKESGSWWLYGEAGVRRSGRTGGHKQENRKWVAHPWVNYYAWIRILGFTLGGGIALRRTKYYPGTFVGE